MLKIKKDLNKYSIQFEIENCFQQTSSKLTKRFRWTVNLPIKPLNDLKPKLPPKNI